MSEIFITSDLHFSHNREFLYQPRGFTNIEEMNATIVDRWNSVVSPQDTVYNLGDFALNNIEVALPYIEQLNGDIIWILCNHDTSAKISAILQNCFNVRLNHSGYYAAPLKFNKTNFFLCHYPTLTSNFDDKHFSQHVIALHGHTHSKEKWQDLNNPFLYNVALDAHNCYPVNIEQIITDVRNKWNEMRLSSYE